MAGANVGASVHSRSDSGVVVGAEVSAANFDRETKIWYGGFFDTLRDFGTGQWRSHVGPEMGWGPLGLDVAATFAWASGGPMFGFRLRPMLSLGVIHVYGSWQHVGSAQDPNFAEIGVLLKLPIREPAREPRHHWPPPPPDEAPADTPSPATAQNIQ